MIHSCPACAERLPLHAPEPLLSDPLPSRPFENTAADLFHYSGRTFLVYTDHYSGCPAIGTTGRTATSLDVIYLLNEVDDGQRHPNPLQNGRRRTVCPAGILRLLPTVGHSPRPQQSPPPRPEWSHRGCCKGHESTRSQDHHHRQNRR